MSVIVWPLFFYPEPSLERPVATDQLVFTRMGQMTSSKLATRVIGIDVAKDKIDVSDATPRFLHNKKPIEHRRHASKNLGGLGAGPQDLSPEETSSLKPADTAKGIQKCLFLNLLLEPI